MSLAKPETPGKVLETPSRFERLFALCKDIPKVCELVETEIVELEHIVHGERQDGVWQ